ncbi:MAG TPA: thioredoxin domain-containing protein [Candidatus Magasanikbacteria bacterium]|nr:thioredoxin domain-containing protein [Candidatus Magasanikbacteria bacterium]
MKKIFISLIVILAGLTLITLSTIKQSSKIIVKPISKPLIENNAIQLPVDDSGPIFGNPGAPITVTEFFSFECDECAKIHTELIEFIKQRPSQVRLISQGINTENWLGNKNIYPFLALFCAEQQNKYWDFLNKSIQLKKIDEKAVKNTAFEINLNSDMFENCLTENNNLIGVEREQAKIKSFGITKTPIIFINNKRINLIEDMTISTILNSIIAK